MSINVFSINAWTKRHGALGFSKLGNNNRNGIKHRHIFGSPGIWMKLFLIKTLSCMKGRSLILQKTYKLRKKFLKIIKQLCLSVTVRNDEGQSHKCSFSISNSSSATRWNQGIKFLIALAHSSICSHISLCFHTLNR